MKRFLKSLFKKKCKHQFDTITIIDNEAIVLCSKCGVRK